MLVVGRLSKLILFWIPFQLVLGEHSNFDGCLENLVYHFFRQLWLVLGVKLMEINSNLFSRWCFFSTISFVIFSIKKSRWNGFNLTRICFLSDGLFNHQLT